MNYKLCYDKIMSKNSGCYTQLYKLPQALTRMRGSGKRPAVYYPKLAKYAAAHIKWDFQKRGDHFRVVKGRNLVSSSLCFF